MGAKKTNHHQTELPNYQANRTMTHETQSSMSSLASISGVVSIFDVDSTISIEGKTIIPGTPGNIEDGPFDLGDGDLSITVR